MARVWLPLARLCVLADTPLLQGRITAIYRPLPLRLSARQHRGTDKGAQREINARATPTPGELETRVGFHGIAWPYFTREKW